MGSHDKKRRGQGTQKLTEPVSCGSKETFLVLYVVCLLTEGFFSQISILLLYPLFHSGIFSLNQQSTPQAPPVPQHVTHLKGPTGLHRCFHLFWLVRPLLRLSLGKVTLVYKLKCLIKRMRMYRCIP